MKNLWKKITMLSDKNIGLYFHIVKILDYGEKQKYLCAFFQLGYCVIVVWTATGPVAR